MKTKSTKARHDPVQSLPDLFDFDEILSSCFQPSDNTTVDSMLHWRGSPSSRFAHLRASLFPSTSLQPKNLIELGTPINPSTRLRTRKLG